MYAVFFDKFLSFVFSVLQGEYTLYVGEYQPDERSFELTGKRSSAIKLRANEDIIIDSAV